MGNPHAPFPRCFILKSATKEDFFALGHGSRPKFPEAYSIHVHHNIGNFEMFMNLKPLRSRLVFDQKSSKIGRCIRDTTKVYWLKEFIKLVGKDKALEITELSRRKSSLEDKAITERLRRNETVDFVYEWNQPNPDLDIGTLEFE